MRHGYRAGLIPAVVAGLTVALVLGGLRNSVLAAPYIGVVNGNEVNVRTGGSQNHYAFSVVKRGQRVIVDREANGWCRIHIPRWIPVFVHEDYVDLKGTHGVVKAGDLNVRVVPAKAHEVVGTFKFGSEIEVLGKETEWYRVVPPPGVYGFIHERYISKEREIAPSEVGLQLSLITASTLGSPMGGERRSAPLVGGGSSPLRSDSPALRRAQALLEQVSGQEPHSRDYALVRAIYEAVRDSSEDRTEVRAAEAGLSEIQRLEEISATVAAAEQSVTEVEKTNRELEDRVRTAGLTGRRSRGDDADPYVARGWLTAVGRLTGHPGTHRLMKGSQVLYYLQSEEGSMIALDAYTSKRVGVKGVIKDLDAKFGANLIVVSELVVLSDR